MPTARPWIKYIERNKQKYTIKRNHSEKTVTEEGWQHSKVELQPLNPDFDTIELDEFGEYKTIGVFKSGSTNAL